MTKELVLLPKAEYEKLLSDNKIRTDSINDSKSLTQNRGTNTDANETVGSQTITSSNINGTNINTNDTAGSQTTKSSSNINANDSAGGVNKYLSKPLTRFSDTVNLNTSLYPTGKNSIDTPLLSKPSNRMDDQDSTYNSGIKKTDKVNSVKSTRSNFDNNHPVSDQSGGQQKGQKYVNKHFPNFWGTKDVRGGYPIKDETKLRNPECGQDVSV